jgi:tetratricopeptide (TPR) repeat protein
VRAFSRAIALHPDDTWALNNLVMAYRDLGQRGKARKDLERALGIDPAFEQAKLNLDALAERLLHPSRLTGP